MVGRQVDGAVELFHYQLALALRQSVAGIGPYCMSPPRSTSLFPVLISLFLLIIFVDTWIWRSCLLLASTVSLCRSGVSPAVQAQSVPLLSAWPFTQPCSLLLGPAF